MPGKLVYLKRGYNMRLSKLNDIKAYNKKIALNVNLLSKEKLNAFPWGQLYIDNANTIDNIAYKMFGENVLEDVTNPLETYNTSLLLEELTDNTDIFLQTATTSINNLWKMESVNFSPIENYDRYEDITTTRSGNENTEFEKAGTETETTTTTGNVINSLKNNQTETTKNEPTSYTTNLVDTSTTEYSGDADTNTTSYDNLQNTKENSYTNRKDTTTHTYNDIKDKHEAHIHGNIGVTTATAMMTEYVDFYSTYNFWVKFWEIYVTINCRADFCTESE